MSNQLQNILDEIKVEKDSKLLPENIKKGVQIFDITGTLEGGTSTDVPVKLFGTVEEMQADTATKEGGLAIVYKNELQNSTSSSEFQVAVFPKTVVLPEALTTSVNIRYRATDDSAMFDCYGNLDASYFSMSCYTEAGEIRIEYESSDGITYTRTDGGDETIDFGTEIRCYRSTYWNDVLGYFIQIGSSYFGGLFEYAENVADYDYFPIYKNGTASYDGSSISYNMNDEYTNGLTDLFSYINSKLSGASGMLVLEDFDGQTATKATLYKGKGGVYLDNTGITRIYNETLTVGATITSQTFSEIHHFDMIAGTYEKDSLTMNVETISGGGKITVLRELTDVYYTRIALATGNLEDITVMTKNNATYFVSTTKKQQPKIVSKYVPADSQLTLDNANQLLPNVIGYGKDGIVTGTSDVYDNLDNSIILEKVHNLIPSADEYFSNINSKGDLWFPRYQGSDFSKATLYMMKNTLNSNEAKATMISKKNCLFDKREMFALVNEVGLSLSWGTAFNYAEFAISDDNTTLSIYINTSSSYDCYIIDLTNKTLITTFKGYSMKYYKSKLFYFKEKISTSMTDLNLYCYDLNTQTEIIVSKLYLGSFAISSYYTNTISTNDNLLAVSIYLYTSSSKGEVNTLFIDMDSLQTTTNTFGWSISGNYVSNVAHCTYKDGIIVILGKFTGSSNPVTYYMIKCDKELNKTTLCTNASVNGSFTLKSSTGYYGFLNDNTLKIANTGDSTCVVMELGTTITVTSYSFGTNVIIMPTLNGLCYTGSNASDIRKYTIDVECIDGKANLIYDSKYDIVNGALRTVCNGSATIVKFDIPYLALDTNNEYPIIKYSTGSCLFKDASIKLYDINKEDYEFMTLNVACGAFDANSSSRLISLTESAVISQEEYNTAVNIADDILGGTE